MAESEKKTTTKREESTKNTQVKGTRTQSIVIAVLATVIVCAVIIFGILLATGVIKFGDSKGVPENASTGQITPGTDNKTSKIVPNSNQRVIMDDDYTLASVEDLEFYLPDDFKAGGKNDDGAYTYNLVDDDGWAQVLVYVEKSDLTPEKYLMKIGPYLDITNRNYTMNDTNWVVGENANSLAYATELDGTIYAVYYSVKLDSDDTAKAMQTIPKTLYMKKVYSN